MQAHCNIKLSEIQIWPKQESGKHRVEIELIGHFYQIKTFLAVELLPFRSIYGVRTSQILFQTL